MSKLEPNQLAQAFCAACEPDNSPSVDVEHTLTNAPAPGV